MNLDFLTPGDWRDSYESRIANDNCSQYDFGGYEVRGLNDIINVCKVYMSKKDNKDRVIDWRSIDVYVDGKLFGMLNPNSTLTVLAPTVCDWDRLLIYYPHGRENKTISLS